MSNYVDKDYYLNTYKGTAIPESEIEKRLKEASLHIDTLTYNRIVGRGFDNLTKFQQDIIQEVVCKLADFEYENEDLIKTVLSSYSINGVAMSFSSGWNVEIQNGVAISKDDYCLLRQTGLTCRNVRY
ncbi:MAG: hypothetical protein IJV31_02660 [Clostridia bacterium]|nr:hypothetical protein [Clostridia bacterium]